MINCLRSVVIQAHPLGIHIEIENKNLPANPLVLLQEFVSQSEGEIVLEFLFTVELHKSECGRETLGLANVNWPGPVRPHDAAVLAARQVPVLYLKMAVGTAVMVRGLKTAQLELVQS